MTRVRKVFLVFGCLALAFTGPGCQDSGGHNISDSTIIRAIGVDREAEGYQVTLSVFSGGEEGEEAPRFLTGSGPTLALAMQQAAQGEQESPYMGHNEILVLDREVARAHLDEVTTFFLSDATARPNMNLFVSDEEAGALLQNTAEEAPDALEVFVRRNKSRFQRLFELHRISGQQRAFCLPVIRQEEEQAVRLGEYMVFGEEGYLFSYTEQLDLITAMLGGGDSFYFSGELPGYGAVSGRVDRARFSYHPKKTGKGFALTVSMSGTVEELTAEQANAFRAKEDAQLVRLVEERICSDLRAIARRAGEENKVDLFGYGWYMASLDASAFSAAGQPDQLFFEVKLDHL